MGLNVRVFEKAISERLALNAGKLAENALRKEFTKKKEDFLKAFDKHPVTIELQCGASDPMTSSSFISKGNLFSLLGFEASQDPTTALRQYLNDDVTLDLNNKKITYNNGQYTIKAKVKTPTLNEVDTNAQISSPLSWIKGKSWVKLLQEGITGFGQFIATKLNTPKPSRSGGGIQSKKEGAEYLSGSVGPIKYINELLTNFRSSLKIK